MGSSTKPAADVGDVCEGRNDDEALGRDGDSGEIDSGNVEHERSRLTACGRTLGGDAALRF